MRSRGFGRFEETHFRNGVVKWPESKPRSPGKKETDLGENCYGQEIDFVCVQYRYRPRGVKYADGSMIAIDCTLVEAEIVRNVFESSELEWLVYNAPVDYVNLLFHGDVREYLRNVMEYRGFDN